jgi:hypothetical protein
VFKDSSIFAIIRKLDGKFGDKSPFASVASLHALFKVINVNEHDDDDRHSGCGGLASGSPMLRFGALHGLFVASTRAPNPQTISGQIAANMFACGRYVLEVCRTTEYMRWSLRRRSGNHRFDDQWFFRQASCTSFSEASC